MTEPTEQKYPGSVPAVPFLLASFFLYAIWPPFALALGYRFFEHAWEAGLLFGGVTGIVLIPVQLIVQMQDSSYAILIGVIWFLIWVVATYLFARRPKRLYIQVYFLVGLSLFSLANSGLGLLMVLTKGV